MSVAQHRYFVYVLARPNGKAFYVGKGQGRRAFRHESEARSGHSCRKCNTIRKIWKDGGEVQRYIVFTTNDESEALAYECELIALYGRKNLTNYTDGGDGRSGSIPKPETRIKLRVTTKSTWGDPDVRRRRIDGQKAYWNSPDARVKGSIASKSHTATLESRTRVSVEAKARWADPDIRAKQTVALNAVWDDPEYRERIRAARKATWSDPEYRAKMSAIHKARLASPEARMRQSIAAKKGKSKDKS